MSSRRQSAFHNALRDLIRGVTHLPTVDFEQRWQRAYTKADQPWVSQTSGFDAESWLLQCACEEFSEFELLSRPDIHDLFFRFKRAPGYGKHLVGSEFDFRFPDGITERVKILDVFLGPRYGKSYRF